jgi:amino acid transporter
MGCVAGEVKNPRRSYTWGLIFANCLVLANYVIPLAIGVMIDGRDYTKWEEGYYIHIGREVTPWLGSWMLIATTISITGTINVLMSSASRAMWRVAKYGMIPRVFGNGPKREDGLEVPVIALFTYCLFTLIIALFGSFQSVLQLDNFHVCFRLLMEFGAFIYLKHSERDLHRPVQVPGGILGAIMITIPMLGFVVFTLSVAKWQTWIIGSSILLFSLALYPLWINGYLKSLGFGPSIKISK